LDDVIFAHTNRILEKALEGGTHATRKELVAILERSKVTGSPQRFAQIFLRAELDGVICSGATRGKQQTYALLDERAPEGISLDGEEALAEITRRYFASRGPGHAEGFLVVVEPHDG
jgi:hypothetical protein